MSTPIPRYSGFVIRPTYHGPAFLVFRLGAFRMKDHLFFASQITTANSVSDERVHAIRRETTARVLTFS